MQPAGANRTKWDEDVARGWPHAAAVPLTERELDARRAELQRLSRTSLPWRTLHYLLGCWAYQTFSTAVLICAVTAGVTAPAGSLFSAVAHSGQPCCFRKPAFQGRMSLVVYLLVNPAKAAGGDLRQARSHEAMHPVDQHLSSR